MVAPRDDRLAWLTGFTGSAGVAATLGDQAAIFVDGRYTIQAREQTDPDAFAQLSLTGAGLNAWLEDNLQPGQTLGFDPWLHTLREKRQFERICERVGAELQPVETNPVDTIWEDQPPPPAEPVEIHPPRLPAAPRRTSWRTSRRHWKSRARMPAFSPSPKQSPGPSTSAGATCPHLPVALCFAILHREGRADPFHRSRTARG